MQRSISYYYLIIGKKKKKRRNKLRIGENELER